MQESEYKNCPHCENVGWYADANPHTGEPEQVQCEFCYTEENSIFNVIQSLTTQLEEAKEKQLRAPPCKWYCEATAFQRKIINLEAQLEEAKEEIKIETASIKYLKR